jgi:hypothetical protein
MLEQGLTRETRSQVVRSRRAADRQSGARPRGEVGASRPAFRAFGVRVRRRPGCSSRRRSRSHPNSPPDAQRRQRPRVDPVCQHTASAHRALPAAGFRPTRYVFQHGMPSGAGLSVGGWRQSGIRQLERRRPRAQECSCTNVPRRPSAVRRHAGGFCCQRRSRAPRAGAGYLAQCHVEVVHQAVLFDLPRGEPG